MSGYSPFGLSALGSMSSLGNLAQAGQRLDRFNDMMSSSRNQGGQGSGGWNRDKQRRSLDDDIYRDRRGGNRRSGSPSRLYNDDTGTRRHNQRRGGNQRRNRGNDSFGSAAGGAGILGAAPGVGDSRGGSSLSGLGDLSGFGSQASSLQESSVTQLNNSAQQLINMMQTQQLLAAANMMNNSKPPSLMGQSPVPNQGYSRRGGHGMNQRNNNWNNRNDRSWHGRQDRKRKMSPPRNPLPKRDRRGDNRNSRFSNDNKKFPQKRKDDKDNKDEKNERAKRDSKTDTKVDKDAAEDQKKKSAQKEEEKAKPAEKNAAGEDVDALVKANFDGNRYWCSVCKIVCLKPTSINKHFFSKRHVKTVIESQGKEFDPAIMKAPKVEKKNDVKVQDKGENITESLKYVCNSRKIARKENNDVIISSQHECTVTIRDFATTQNFMGSEFIKAISGFKCQLCKAFIRSGKDVKQHIKGKRHRGNYEAYLHDHPNYQDTQMEVNKSLMEILEKQDGQDVQLFEVNDNEPVDGAQAAEQLENNCTLEENNDEDDVATYSMEEHPVDDSYVLEDDVPSDEPTVSQGDAVLDESKSSMVPDELTEEELEKELLSEDVNEDVDEEEMDDKHVDELVLSPTIPFLGESIPSTEDVEVKEEPVEEKAKEQEKPAKVTKKAKKEQKEKEEKESSASEASSVKEEVEETPAPGRRGARRGKGRGRGASTRGTRGKTTRRSGRAAKNAKKSEVAEEVSVEPVKETKEKSPEPAKEEEAPKPSTDEPSTTKETTEDTSFFEGFEVIDEIIGGEDDDDDDDEE